MDRIKIQNLEVFGHHGVFSEETKLGQKFLVNATLYTNTRAAGYSDDLEKSINYGEVCHFITGYMQNHTFKLIEAVAEHMAQAMLMEYPLLQKLDLEIRKPWAPIGLLWKCISGDQPRLAYSLSLCMVQILENASSFAGSSETFAGMQ